MKYKILSVCCILFGINFSSTAQPSDASKYVIEHDNQVRKEEPGTHNGGGQTIGYTFFNNVPGYKTAFKKRTLKPGSSIGYHLQTEDEVYYIIEGKGEMKINGNIIPVKPGDAVLTRTGSSHSITPAKDNDLTIIIVYDK